MKCRIGKGTSLLRQWVTELCEATRQVRIARLRILPIGLGIEHGEQGFALSGSILDSGSTPAARAYHEPR